MADIIKNTDEVGNILVKVKEDLCQLKQTLTRVTIQGAGETVDIQALHTAIRRTENGLRKRAEEYLNAVNRQVLTLPAIEEGEKPNTQAAKWKPQLKTVPDLRLQRSPDFGMAGRPSPGEQHKSGLRMKVMCNPAHPAHRALLHEQYGIRLPGASPRKGGSAQLQKVVHGPTVGSLAVVPAAQRNNPYLAPPLSQNDMKTGISSLLERGLIPAAAQLILEQPPVRPEVAPLHARDKAPSAGGTGPVSGRAVGERMDLSLSLREELEPGYSSCDPSWQAPIQGPVTPPPSVTSKRSATKHRPPPALTSSRLCPIMPEPLLVMEPLGSSKNLSFTILNGQVEETAPEFSRFKRHYCLSWGSLAGALRRLTQVLREYAVPVAVVSGPRMAELAQGGELDGGGLSSGDLISTLLNQEEVWEIVRRPGQRYRGEGGTEAAAVAIQTSWRCYRVRSAYLRYRRQKWAAGVIAISWLLHAQMARTRKALQASRQRHLENFRSRAEHLAANWKHIRSSRRSIIHIPSLGRSQPLRFSLKDLDMQQGTQLGRLCDVRDENVEVIYVSPVALGEEMQQYYSRLLGLQGAVTKAEPGDTPTPSVQRFTILTPDALGYFPTHSMCLSTLLKYSPRTLRRIKNLIRGKPAYIVGGALHADDLDVADTLGVPILGPEPALAELYSTKSGSRRVFSSAGVALPPGHGDIYTLQQLYDALSQLITDHLEVERWLLKVDSEFGGRGTAFCDVSHMSCYAWALKEFRRYGPDRWSHAWAQEQVLLKVQEELPSLLARHAQPVNTSHYPTWDNFLQHFLREGGVVEAYPPSDSVTCLTVDMLIEPNGEVSMLSCGDQIHGSSVLKAMGSSVPQASVCPDTLHAICTHIARACHQRGVIGHFSVDLATFLHPRTLEQQVWAIDLDLCYSDQLAMTQLLLMMTGGRLDCRASCLEVPAPPREVRPARRQRGPAAVQPAPVTSRYVVMSSRLRHTNLSMVHYSVFFQMCKAQGVGFDIKERQGSLFVLHDSSRRYSLGMLTIAEDLQGALLTFARNLSVIHQEISAPNMQGQTNFKELIRDIEGILGVTVENQASSSPGEDSSAS
nr:PREDICTED: IQ domain-containing protein H isoform X2 [Lepisosteus oculatus]